MEGKFDRIINGSNITDLEVTTDSMGERGHLEKTRAQIFETVDRVLNSSEYAKMINDAFMSRGLQIVIYTHTDNIVDDDDLISVGMHERIVARKFVVSNIEKLRRDYAEANNHHLNDILVKKFIPLLVDAWNKGQRDIVSFKIGLPLPNIPRVTPTSEELEAVLDPDTSAYNDSKAEGSMARSSERDRLSRDGNRPANSYSLDPAEQTGFLSSPTSSTSSPILTSNARNSNGHVNTKKECLDAFIRMCHPCDVKISSTDLVKIYTEWCSRNNYTPYTYPKVIDAFRKSHLSGDEVRDNKSRSKGWRIRLVGRPSSP